MNSYATPIVPDTSIDDLKALFTCQKAASNANPYPSYEERCGNVEKLLKLTEKHKHDICNVIDKDFGNRSVRETTLSDLFLVIQGAKHARRHLRKWMRPRRVGTSLHSLPATCKVVPQPLGVIGNIAPWNYPYLTAINSIIPALMAGNTVLLKHSAQTPLCAEQLARAFQVADLPAGVFQYLHLSHQDTEMIIAQPHINTVAFTGSVAGGKVVEQASSGRFITVGLELGGKDPAYVRADADIEYAVETCIDGAFFNSGQSCCGIERLYVASEIFDDFVSRAVALVNQYKLGRSDSPDTTLGPMVRTAAADFVRGQIRDAIDAGAMAHLVPANFPMDSVGSPYLAPQVLTNVNHSMRLMIEESFGPVLGIMAVANDDEAVALMNDSEFGLTACVFSRDLGAAIAIGERLETGTFFLNRCDYLDPALAWTGVKNSGRGCTLSALGYERLTRPKSFHLKLPA